LTSKAKNIWEIKSTLNRILFNAGPKTDSEIAQNTLAVDEFLIKYEINIERLIHPFDIENGLTPTIDTFSEYQVRNEFKVDLSRYYEKIVNYAKVVYSYSEYWEYLTNAINKNTYLLNEPNMKIIENAFQRAINNTKEFIKEKKSEIKINSMDELDLESIMKELMEEQVKDFKKNCEVCNFENRQMSEWTEKLETELESLMAVIIRFNTLKTTQEKEKYDSDLKKLEKESRSITIIYATWFVNAGIFRDQAEKNVTTALNKRVAGVQFINILPREYVELFGGWLKKTGTHYLRVRYRIGNFYGEEEVTVDHNKELIMPAKSY